MPAAGRQGLSRPGAAHAVRKTRGAPAGSGDFEEDDGNVVDGGAFAPVGDAVEDALLHFVEWERRRFPHDG